jgi:hypothetical protein
MALEVQVFMRHIRAAKLCSGGARIFASRHGLNWNDFLTNGISSATLEEIGDPMTLRAVEAARAEVTDGR